VLIGYLEVQVQGQVDFGKPRVHHTRLHALPQHRRDIGNLPMDLQMAAFQLVGRSREISVGNEEEVVREGV
jgi:hypothetical protein